MRLVHSYSALKLYEQCGLRYYRQRIVKDVHEQETKYTTHGNIVHKAIELNVANNTPLPPELAGYTGPARALKDSAEKGRTVGCEKNFGLDNDFNPSDYWGDAVWIRAKLDVLVTGGPKPESASIIDWKTGKRRIDFTQLKIAAIAVFKSFTKLNEIKASFVWLKDQVMDKETYTRDQLPGLIQELNPRLLAIEEAQITNVWKPKPSYLCNYCPCQPTCSYALKKR